MRFAAAGILVMLVLFGLLAAVWVFDRPTPSEAPSPSVSAARELGVWEDRLALFDRDATHPVTVYEVWIATLPTEEQARLAARVPIPDEETLRALLEDYTG